MITEILIGVFGTLIFLVLMFISMRIGYMAGCKDWEQTKKWIESQEKRW